MLKLLFLSRIHDKKGIFEFVKVLNSISFKGYVLDIYGWGEDESINQLQKEIAKNTQINFHGPIFGELKIEVLKSADILVLPSKSEGLPVVVLEAWKYGLVTAITRECNLPEAIERDATLLLDLLSLKASTVDMLKLTSSDLEVYQKKASVLYEEKFSEEKIKAAYLAMYYGNQG